MSNYARCKTCGNYDWADTHKCPPLWEIRMDGDSEWTETHGHDEEDAVKSWLNENDCHQDYGVIRAGSATYFVRSLGAESPGVRVEVEAESVPQYYCHKRT